MRFEPLVVTTPIDTPYFENPRTELIDVARRLGVSGLVLDAGCGAGAFGAALTEAGIATEVTGIELDPEAAAAAARTLDRVVVGDLADDDLYDELPDGVDCVVAADVLEHLRHPEHALARLTSRLAEGGRWIISVPNVRNARLLLDLALHDRWDYGESGICDTSHLRFFTTSSIVKLCRSVGLEPDAGFWLVAGRSGAIARIARPLGSFAAVQIVVSGRR